MKSWFKRIMTWCRQRWCHHEFRIGECLATNYPKPPEPSPSAGHKEWMDYHARLALSDWNTKRVQWPCCKCGRVFEAQCGLDILCHGKYEPEYHTYTATHSGWLLFCPLWLANLDSEAPVPLPRRFIPDWWFDFNFWLNEWLQWGISWVAPDSVGYLFYGVHPLPEPKVVRVKAE